MDKLQWMIELMDRASGPARAIAASLNKVKVAKDQLAKDPATKVFDSLERASTARRTASRNRMGRELEQFAVSQRAGLSAGSSWGASMATALLAVGAAAISAAAAVGRIGFELGRSAAEAADWRNRTLGAFDVLGRASNAGPGQARAMFETGSRYATRFGLDVREVQRSLVGLTAAGMRRDRALQIMQAAGDLGALEGGQAGERAITAFRQIQAKGLLQMEELQGQLSEAGLNTGDVIAEIGRMRGLRGSSQTINTQVRSLITNRQVNATQGIDAALRVIARRSGGRLGGTLETQATGMGAAINRLNNGWLMVQSTFANTAGFQHVIKFIEKLASALDPATQTGQRFAAIMNRVFDDVLGLLNISDKNTKGGFAAIFNKALDSIESTINGVRVLAKWIGELGGGYFSVIGPTLQAIATAASWVMRALGGPESQDTLNTLRLIGQVLGVLVVIAGAPFVLLVTVVSALAYAFWKVGEFLAYVIDKFDEFIGMTVPDWLLSLLGAESAPSFEAMQAATNIVNRGRAEGVGRPIVSQPNVTVNVNALTNGQMTPEEIAASAGAVIPGVVQTSAERAANAGG